MHTCPSYTHAVGWFLCDLTPACSVWSILPPCWLQAGLFRPRSPRPAWTVSALCAGAIWLHRTTCWEAAESPDPGAAEPDAHSAELGPLAQQHDQPQKSTSQSCHVNTEISTPGWYLIRHIHWRSFLFLQRKTGNSQGNYRFQKNTF